MKKVNNLGAWLSDTLIPAVFVLNFEQTDVADNVSRKCYMKGKQCRP